MKTPIMPSDSDTPRRYVLEERIRFIAEHSEKVVITDHAIERMIERDITTAMMFRVLQSGTIEGDVRAGKRPGDWVAKMVAKVKGHRETGVITAVLKDDKLVVITVEWEDWR